MTGGKGNNISKCESDTIKDVIKIRLHMWNTKCNYKRIRSDTTCPLCKTEEGTHRAQNGIQEGNNMHNLLDKNEKDQEKQLQYTRIIKKIEENQNNKKVQKEKICNRRLK